MSINLALDWIVRLTELHKEVRDNTVFITLPKERLEAEKREHEKAVARELEERKLNQQLRVRYADGREIQLDGPLVRDLGPGILERVNTEPPAPPVNTLAANMVLIRRSTDLGRVEDDDHAMRLLRRVAPGCEIHRDGEIWIVTAKDPKALQAADILVQFLRAQQHPIPKPEHPPLEVKPAPDKAAGALKPEQF